MSEIQTNRSDFRHFSLFEAILNRTDTLCPKSEHVRISDVDYTVNVRKPDVRFSDFWRLVRLVKRPVIGLSSENRTLYPVFGSSGSIYFLSPVFGRPVPNRPKPVPNRFWSEMSETSENRTLYPVFRRYIRFQTSENRI